MTFLKMFAIKRLNPREKSRPSPKSVSVFWRFSECGCRIEYLIFASMIRLSEDNQQISAKNGNRSSTARGQKTLQAPHRPSDAFVKNTVGF